jgi:hypothetical protein
VNYGISFSSCFLPARPPWLCGGGACGRPQPDPLARWTAPGIAARCARAGAARRLRDRHDRLGRRDPPACTPRQRRDRAVTAVTGVIAVIAVIAGIVLLGPVRAAPHGGQGGRSSRDLRAGRDRRDPSRLIRPHGGHGPTAAAVIARGPCPP